MTVKGYYPSLSLGFGLLFSLINMLSGVAMIVASVILLLNRVAILTGMVWISIGGLIVGIMAFAAGALAMLGSCSESVSTMRMAYALSIITLLGAISIAAYALIASKSLNDNNRHAWFQFTNEQKEMIQEKYSCCGYTNKDEGTEDCKPDTTCSEPIMADLGGILKVMTILSSIIAGGQLLATGCGACVSSKMREQQEKKKRKASLRLEHEAGGGGYSRKSKTTTKAKDGKK